MSLKIDIQEVAFINDMDYFGISSIERFANIPAGHRPNDLLPMARSVIVMGLRIPEGAIEANNRAFDGLKHAIFSYILFGYNKINEKLDLTALRVARHIEKNNKNKAYPIPSGAPRDEYLIMGEMSNRYAAVCAGLGEFGWSGFVLTQQDGPRVRWVSVITDLEIEPDPLYQGPKLCDHHNCNICVDACPVQALDGNKEVPVKIGNYMSGYALRNKVLCQCATYGLVKGTPGRLQAEIPKNIYKNEDWLKLYKKDDPWQRMERSHGNYCHRCLTQCPVGKLEALEEQKWD